MRFPADDGLQGDAAEHQPAIAPGPVRGGGEPLLVAALSLGIDLGFGQPMEHVLRQCLIALRLAGQAGADGQERVAVYYTALLVSVGCHADAHEQAKWFGDDIAPNARAEPASRVMEVLSPE